ncbi:hypothetical protein BH11PSE11_BH11PSE11_32620 [soil metagenome]
MENTGFAYQLRRNSLSLLSLVIAISALFYNTWRNESTERNRNIRTAEFEMLKYLGEVQQIIDYAHFRKDQQRGDLTMGLSRVLLIHDLAMLTPKPVAESADRLRTAWAVNGDKIATDLEAASTMSEEVLNTRRAVLASLRELK